MKFIRNGSKAALSWKHEGEQYGPVELFVVGDRDEIDAKHDLERRLATISITSSAGAALDGKVASDIVRYRHGGRMFEVHVVKVLDDEIALDGEVVAGAV